MTQRIVMVGAGPRGTYCLRRLFLFLEKNPLSDPLHVDIIEKSGFFGSGAAHSAALPDYLLLNTVGGQIIAFGMDDEEALADNSRESLWSYLKANGEDIEFNDYPSRSQHGMYLRDMFAWTVDHAPENVTVTLRHTEAMDIRENISNGYKVELKDGQMLDADEIILLTGHGVSQIKPGSEQDAWRKFAEAARKKGKSTSYIHYVYPLPGSLEHVKPGETVYVIGMGLTAIDIVKAFSKGRGGVFTESDYIPSGKEPKLILGSRLGLPCMAKVKNQRTEKYKAKVLTFERARSLRGLPGKLDFKKEIFPLILEEMTYVYYMFLKGEAFAKRWIESGSAEIRQQLIENEIAPDQRFSWNRLEDPFTLLRAAKDDKEPLFNGFDEYLDFVISMMELDVLEAEKGNMTSPLKGAIDAIFRDLRGFLRIVIDRGGLTADSHRFLVGSFNRVNNRIAAGPPASAIRELLTLTRKGIVSFSGPNPNVEMDEATGGFILDSEGLPGARRPVDHVLNGRIHSVDSKNDSSPLVQSLLRKGWAKNFVNSDDTGVLELGGLDVSEDFQLIGDTGDIKRNICVLGIPLEGIYWFNSVAADNRSYGNPFTIRQLDQWVETAVSRLRNI